MRKNVPITAGKNAALLLFFITLVTVSCRVQKSVSISPNSQVRLIGQYNLPNDPRFKNTTVGGLSGIDYDQKNGIYYLISDDRSAINPARFYTAKIYLKETGIDSIVFLSVKSLLRGNGSVYPGSKQDPYHTPDPEGIRYDPRSGNIVWTSEGERIIKNDSAVLEDPSVNLVNTEGRFLDSFQLPANLHIQGFPKGPRQNGVLEGLTFADGYKSLLVNVEEPLYEDGPRAGWGDSTGWIRITKFDISTRRPLAQYAYQIDPVAYRPLPAGAFRINGVPDILSVGKNRLLLVERSFSTGRKPCTIKLYTADMRGATNILGTVSLQEQTGWKPVKKTLLLNMDSLGIFTDNIEGVCFGPVLSNGHRTLIFVADNNFSAEELNQFLLFEVD